METTSRKSNYALITALYANKRSGFYTDIYFPIVKYAIAKLFISYKNSNNYYTTAEVQELILDSFGIKIPTLVIAKSVEFIGKQPNKLMNVEVFENGNNFEIISASYDEDIEEKERHFTVLLNKIQEEYKKYLEERGLVDDNLEFVQFLADNTDDILRSFQDVIDSEINESSNEKVNDKYATLVFFLQYLNSYDKEMFKVANQLFWSSIIVAFLKSEKPQTVEKDNNRIIEYYLDTSIILGLLDLSTPEKETYSKETIEIIKSSQGVLYVNPMTIEEIKRILEAVEESTKPNPNTDIYSAWRHHEFTLPNYLTNIRIHISDYLKKLGIEVKPIMSPGQLQKEIGGLKDKEIVKLLGKYRHKLDSYSKDNFREVHDIYMDEFINTERKGKPNNIYFLTTNTDLIRFCKTKHPEVENMKSTGQVVLDLWMHNANRSDVPEALLTASMARCLDLHKIQVRNKIREVSKYYNSTKENFDEAIYLEYIQKLFARSKNVINTLEINPESIGDDAWGRLIKEAVDADNEHANERMANQQERNRVLGEKLSEKEVAIESINQEVEELNKKVRHTEEQVNDEKIRNESLLQTITQQEETIAKQKEEIEKERLEKDHIKKRNDLYEQKRNIEGEVKRLDVELASWSVCREKSFRNILGKTLIVLSIVTFVLIGVVSRLMFLQGKSISLFLTISITILIAIVSFAFNCHSNIEERRERAYKKWEDKKENGKYKYLLSEISKCKENLLKINQQLEQ